MFDAENLLHFIELSQFSRRWEQLGLDDEEDLAALQVAIMSNPKVGAVIKDTGGLRKLRFAPPRWNTGKREPRESFTPISTSLALFFCAWSTERMKSETYRMQ